MTYVILLDRITKEKGFGRKTLEMDVRTFLMELAKEVNEKGCVRIPGFGEFKISFTKEHRLSFDTSVIVPAKRTIVFSPENDLKEYINQETKAFLIKKTFQ